MSKFEIIVIVLLAVNGFWNFCCIGLLNKLCDLCGDTLMELVKGIERIFERKN